MYPFGFGPPIPWHQALKDYLIFWVLVDIYFLPTLIAAFKRRSDLFHIVAINLLTAWSIIGWVVAMIIAVADDVGGRYRPRDNLEPSRPAGPPASAHPASQWLYQQQQQQQQAAAPPPPPPGPYDYPGYDS